MEHLGDYSKDITIFAFNHHSNRNLIAQKGVFSYVSRQDLNDRPLITDVMKHSGGDSSEVPLRKYNIGYQHATQAMEYLMKHRRTANAYFPGYDGVVRCMLDYANYAAVLNFEYLRRRQKLPALLTRNIGL